MTRSIVDGFRAAFDNRVIWGILSIEAVNTFFVTYRVLLPVYARDILSVGPTGLGLLYAAPGIGALIGSALAIAMGDVKKKGRLFTISAFTMPLALILFAFSVWMPASLAFLVLAGLLDIVGGTVRNTMLQLSINERMRGRVMSMNMMVHRGIGPLSHLQSGAIASFIGAPWAIGRRIDIFYNLRRFYVAPSSGAIPLCPGHPSTRPTTFLRARRVPPPLSRCALP